MGGLGSCVEMREQAGEVGGSWPMDRPALEGAGLSPKSTQKLCLSGREMVGASW